MIKKEECYLVGKFVKTHGYKGELNIKLDVDTPEDYDQIDSAFVEIKNDLIPHFFERYKLKQNSIATVKIEGIDSDEDAQKLVRKEIYLPLTILPKLTGNKFYYHEIIDFKAIDTELGEIGIIKGVLDGNAQDIFQIIQGKKEILIPVIDEVIVEVNREKKEILLNAPEGLVEFYLNN